MKFNLLPSEVLIWWSLELVMLEQHSQIKCVLIEMSHLYQLMHLF